MKTQQTCIPSWMAATVAMALAGGVAWAVDLHRAEIEYRAIRDRNENGNIPVNALPKAAQQAQQMKFNPDAWPGTASPVTYGPNTTVAGIDTNLWTWVGPGNIGGRIRSIVIHPTATNTLWIGGVDGGVWKTTNGGASWYPLDDFMANLAVSCMVMDPTNPNVIYAGTGEPMDNIDAVQGAGIFKTADGGNTWVQLSATTNSSFNYVSRLALDPNNDANLLASTRNGIFRSTDGGNTWTQTSTTEMLDIAFHPSNSSLAIAAGYGKTYYSTNGGVNWNAASGFPASTGFNGGRIELAYAPSSPTIVYASYDNNDGQIYVSNDGGQTYALVSTPGHLSTQGWYDNCLWVDPTNPNLIVFGGTDVYRSTDGGNTYTDIGGYSGSIHPDQHAIVAIPGYNGSTVATVFVGNDGGMFRAGNITTVSASSGWTTLNHNLGITQYYGAAGNNTSGTIVGGTQDNGTPRVLGTGGTGSFSSMFGGDGGCCAADQSDTNYFYGEYVYLQIFRSNNGGVNASYITSGGLGDAGLPDDNGNFQTFYPPDDKTPPGNDPDGGDGSPPPDPDSAANFIAPFILDPNNFNTMLAGGSNLWRSVNVKAATPAWSNIKTGIASGSFINAVAVASGNSDIIWVGYNSGAVYYTTNGRSANPTWFQSGAATLPARSCDRLTVDPNNFNNVYACFGGYSSGNVYKTANFGATWSNIGAALPSAPANSLVIAPFNSSYLYVGMNVGVFASADGGVTWSTGNLGAANVAVDELFWMGNTLVAATHGRGLFKVSVIPDPLQITPNGGFAAIGYPGGPFSNTNKTYVLTNLGVSSLNWSLANTSAWLQVSLASGTLPPGGASATVVVSLSATAASLAVGNYATTVTFTNTSDGYIISQPFSLQVQPQPDALVVGPAAGLSFYGLPGGLAGASLNFNLTNTGAASLNWGLRTTSVWFTAAAAGGTLASSGGTAAVNVTLTAAANSLALGNYTNTLWFTNLNNGVVQTRPVVLAVQPLVLNGGLETGDFSYWTPSGNFTYCSVSSSSTYVHSGTYGAELGPSGTLGYLSQTLNTTPGQMYSLSFWLNSPDGQITNEFTAAWNGSTLVDLVNLGMTGWVNYQYFAAATSSSTVLQFGFRNDPSYFGLDDIVVYPTNPITNPPAILQQPVSQTVLTNGTVTFTVGVSGTGPFTYQWLFNGTNLPNNIITTVAGNGTNDFSGEGGPALNASLNDPYATAVDPSGNVFIADFSNNRIRKVSANGVISTVAGGGAAGLGDGGAATNASLDLAASAAVDASGNLFIADWGHNRIRQVSPNGVISTVAGGGVAGLGDGGAATNAELNAPYTVTVDASGNLFIADWGNGRIRKVSTNGIITTVAGGGAGGGTDGLGDGLLATNASLNGPFGVAVDAYDNLFITDEFNQRVRIVTTNGVINTFAGGGAGGGTDGLGDGLVATNAVLSYPAGLTVDAYDNVFIADTFHNRIRLVGTNGIITTVAGNGIMAYSGDGGSATQASFSLPEGVAVDGSDDLFIADQNNARIRKVTNTQRPTLTLEDVGSGNAGNYQVVVTGLGGSVTSSVATLTVGAPWCVLQGLDVGNPSLSGSTTCVSSGNYTVVASGYDIFFNSDQFQFAYEIVTNDFDVHVQVTSLTLAGFYAKAGLMARVDLTPGSPNVYGLVTPPNGADYYQFHYRTTENGTTFEPVYNGGAVPIPNAWLRLNRAGNTFTCYSGTDGTNWSPIGQTVMALPATLLLGLATTAATNNEVSGNPLTTAASYANYSVAGATVLAPPVFTSAIPTNGNITLSWAAVAGQNYQVQYATNLNAGGWNNLGVTNTASGSMTASDVMVAGPSRFYRVKLLP